MENNRSINRRFILVALVTVIIVLIIVVGFFYTTKGRNIEHASKQQLTLSTATVSPTNQTSHENEPRATISKIENKIEGVENFSIEIAGQRIQVEVKPLDINHFFLPQKDGLYLYERLSERAYNEPIAARLLSGLLSRCSKTHISKEEHDKAVQRLREEGAHPALDSQFQGEVPEEYVEVVLEEFKYDYEQCKNIDQNKRNEASDWARVAAEGGDFLGLEMFTRDPNISTQERVDAYEKIWSDFGSLESAINLSSILSGVGNHESFSRFAGLEPDPKKAYAYFLASSKIEQAVSQRFNPQETDQLQYELSIFEQLLTSKLSASEHLEAERLAIELIESNRNCCTIDTSYTHEISTTE